jgi:hypothetical protein
MNHVLVKKNNESDRMRALFALVRIGQAQDSTVGGLRLPKVLKNMI